MFFVLINANLLTSGIAAMGTVSGTTQEANTGNFSFISRTGNSIVFRTTSIVVNFSSSTGSIIDIHLLPSNQFINLSGSYPLWSIITMQNVSYNSLQANNFSSLIDPFNSTLFLYWLLSKPKLTVVVSAYPDDFNGGLDMRMNIANYNQSLTIFSVNFPIVGAFSGLGTSRSDNLAIPDLDGIIVNNFQHSLPSGIRGLNYPGDLSMQFFLIYDNFLGGLFNGMEDASSSYKSLNIVNVSKSQPLYVFYWREYPPNIHTGDQFDMNYSVSFAGFAGQDWSEGVQLYQAWALKQWYVKQGPLESRSDVPTWFKNIGLVWLSGPPNSMVNATKAAQKMSSNGTVLLDWWGWNYLGFDKGYPQYFPPMGGNSAFQQEVNQTHAEGAKVMLFFSGSLVDTNTTTFQNYKQFMIVNPNGQIRTGNFSNHLVAATPDPTTLWWQSEVVNYTTTAVKEFGVDGVYMDAVARVPPALNYRNATSPTLSGPTWWEAYSTIFTKVRNSIRQYNPNAIVTSEGVCEVYIPFIDGFWDNFGAQQSENQNPGITQLPLFSYVYHQYALVYGSPPGYDYNNSLPFRYEASNAVTFGEILRVTIPTYNPVNASDSDFLSTSIRVEQDYSGYFRFGLDLPKPIASASDILINFSPRSNSTPRPKSNLTAPSVVVGLYRANNDSLILVVTNPTNLTQTVNLHFYGEEFAKQGDLQSLTVCPTATTSDYCDSLNQYQNFTLSITGLSYSIYHIFPVLAQTRPPQTISTTVTTTKTTQGLPWQGFIIVVSMIVAVASLSISYFLLVSRKARPVSHGS